ncbi:MAG: ABC transporter permease [Nitriliruptor sp.]|nr:MAG: ABC transporter permease [Nitriliruptor sp.]
MTRRQTIALIAGREVRQRLRSKLFVWSTIVLSVAFVILALVPTLIDAFASPDEVGEVDALTTLAVVGELDESRRDALTAALGPFEEEPAADEAAARDLLLDEDGDVDLAIIQGERVLGPTSTGIFGGAGEFQASQAAEALALVDMLEAAGSAEVADRVLTLEPLPVELVGAGDPAEAVTRVIVANIGVVFLFGLLMFYASMIVNGIIEEKGSRVVELLVEAVPVRQLMAGKVLGLGTIAVGQTLALFLPAVVVLVAFNRDLIPPGLGGVLGYTLLWFVLGYAFYTLLCAGLGALVSRPEEAQAVLTPATMLALVGYLVGFAAIQAPDATWAVIAGWVPPTAPFVMLVRQAVGSPTLVEVIGSLVLLVGAIGATGLAAARIYEGGILRVGARVRFRDAWRSRRI